MKDSYWSIRSYLLNSFSYILILRCLDEKIGYGYLNLNSIIYHVKKKKEGFKFHVIYLNIFFNQFS